jgi:hypothetical protein
MDVFGLFAHDFDLKGREDRHHAVSDVAVYLFDFVLVNTLFLLFAGAQTEIFHII